MNRLPHPLWLTVSTICFVWLIRRVARRSSKLPLPPGPPKLPLIGNVHQIGGRRLWELCMEWSLKYNSDIIHLNMAGTSVVVLSSLQVAEALLDKRSSIYSDRPAMPMLELMEWDFLMASQRYGDKWRAQRRLFSQHFNVSASKAIKPRLTTAAHALLRRLLHSPDEFLAHLRLMAGEVIIPLTYGIPVQHVNDPYISLAEEAIKHGAQAAASGTFLVDFLPILKYVPAWMPGAGFQKVAQRGREYSHAMRNIAFEESKRRMNSGDILPSFTGDALRDIDAGDHSYDEDTVRDVAAIMYAAGADTTVSVLATFFLAMLANPDAQEKAQREIDEVGGDLSDFGDNREGMTYVSALVKEVLRWRPATPFAMPHSIIVEDEYSGYRIPAKSVVFPNVWAILHDGKVYGPDPSAFRPERFLCADGKLNTAVPDPQAGFGFGRRICPGRHLAEESIWIAVVSILAVFDIKKKPGVEPSYEYTQGILSEPLPFECDIRVRAGAQAEARARSLASM
ncbi:cytochrome P450 [Roridomyces roridus]|uniref:Cytochrome P450 n=1 Tax=Roridomyces roridus TaxID=1738132 RepID=A0AAD7BBT0_9AGAR|nr:cytochrome P450 [Roridomyces roridus]